MIPLSPPVTLPLPLQSLQAGQWVKLICGASYQDMPTIRRLVMVYALAGVDCIDVAADGAVVAAARQGLADAARVADHLDRELGLDPGQGSHSDLPRRHYWHPDHPPWLMVSLNDSEDPHFRKAVFDPAHCPPECSRPCERLCPTMAIHFEGHGQGGVRPDLCYGCGRCIPVCPIDNIVAHSHSANPEAFSAATLSQIDAVEIHTQPGHQRDFADLWRRLDRWRPWIKLVSVSCPDDPYIVAYLRDLYRMMAPLDVPLIWQTDGRPMSGDLGKGTTHATLRLAQKVLTANLPGYVQLAGGTNAYTVHKLRELGLLRSAPWSDDVTGNGPGPLTQAPRPWVAGIAYGSYARTRLMPTLEPLESSLAPWLNSQEPTSPTPISHPAPTPSANIDSTDALVEAIHQARQLVGASKVHPPP